MKSKLISLILVAIMLITLFQPIILAVDTATKTYQDFEYTVNDKNEITITKYTGKDAEVTIPDIIEENEVCYIGDSAFKGITTLERIVIPNTVTKINAGAFYECSALKNVTLSNCLSEMNAYAFGKCESLTEITIPKSLKKTIEAYSLSFEGGHSYRYGPFIYSNNLKHINFEEGIEEIPEGVFANSQIEEISIPNTVTKISKKAFSGASLLKSVNFSNDLALIDVDAFRETSLEEVSFPNTVTKINTGAFYKCSSLKNVTLPNNLVEMGAYAFGDCDNITSIKIPKSLKNTTTGYSLNYEGGHSDRYGPFIYSDNLKNINFEEGIEEIPIGLFSNSKIDKITIPNTVTKISKEAFSYCTLLKTVEFSDNLYLIDSDVFRGDTALEKVILPNSVEKIYAGAFFGCQKISELRLSKNIEELGAYSFGECDSITRVEIPKSLKRTTTVYSLYYGDGHSSKYGPFRYSDGLKQVTFEEGITTIPEGLFAANSSLETISIPDTVETIGTNAFDYCTGLKNVYLSKNLKNVNGNFFVGCSSDLKIYCDKYSKGMKVCIDKDLNPEFASDTYEDTDDKAILKEKSNLNISTNMVANGYMSIKINYNIKTEKFKNIDNKKIIVRIPKNLELHTSGIKLDSKIIKDYNLNNYILSIPIEKQSGEIVFCAIPKDSSKIKTYAGLSYEKNYNECLEIFDVILENMSPITLVVPEATSNGIVDVKGIAPKGKNVTISVEGKQNVTVQASDTTGKYNAQINVNTNIDHKKYKIIAKSEDSQGKEISAYTYVQYNSEIPEIKSFNMNYSDHNNKQINLLDYKFKSKTLNYYPEVAPSFELEFDNSEKIDKVYVVSTKNGEKKYLEASYDTNKNKYVASGYFDEENKSTYVPGTISYEYSVKRDEIQVSKDYDLENSAFAEIGKEMKENVTVETIKNETNEKEYKYNLDDEAKKLGVKELNIIMKTMDKDFSSAYAVAEDYSNLIKYTTKDGQGNEFELNVDFSDPKEVKTFVHDIASSKTIEYIIKTNIDDPLKAEQFLDNYSYFLQTATFFSDYMEIGYDTQKLKEEILSKNTDYNTTKEALKKAEGLGNDRRKFLIMTTVMSLTVATIGTGGMAAPALVFSMMLSGMGAYSSFMFDYRANQIRGQEFSLNWLIDPSGYVYEGNTNNRLEGVKCTIYYKEKEDSKPVLWDATKYEQENPLYTDSEGRYAWDVPEGLWQVKYEKEGYEPTYSDWLTVPPPQTDVNIAMTRKNMSNNNQNSTNTSQNTNNNINTNITGNTNVNYTKKEISKLLISGISNKTYTGKSLKLSIVVKDGNKTIKNGTDYNVSYKNNKKVGTASVVITGKGNYTGTVTKTFKINPKGTSLKKLTKGKKQFKVTWKKQKKQTSGYEIQYSTNKKFKSGNKKVKIKKNKTTSSTVKKLKAKKKYYVRIRTYKTVNGKTYYSGWSKVKNVTTKK